MKISTALFILTTSTLMALPTYAGEKSSAKQVIEIQPVAPQCSQRQIQPLFSRYAQTTKQWTLRGSYRSFTDVLLQEVDGFDGSSYDVELTVPLSECWQLRLYYPIYTEGDAKQINNDDAVDIEGNGGMLDFPSLTLDYQFMQAATPNGWNMAAYFGVGNVRSYLESTNPRTGVVDRINHRGSVALFGLKADTQLGSCWTFIGNLGGRYYWDSDDIRPNSNSDVFGLVDASAAFVYTSENAWAYPMIELVYQGDFSDYSSLQIVPQIVVPLGSHVDINAGVAVGILDDSPSTDARVQMTLRF